MCTLSFKRQTKIVKQEWRKVTYTWNNAGNCIHFILPKISDIQARKANYNVGRARFTRTRVCHLQRLQTMCTMPPLAPNGTSTRFIMSTHTNASRILAIFHVPRRGKTGKRSSRRRCAQCTPSTYAGVDRVLPAFHSGNRTQPAI